MVQRAESTATAASFALSEAYEKYYQRHCRAVYRRNCRRLSRYLLTARKQVAEDLSQETFHSLYRWMRNFWTEHGQGPSEDIFARALKTIEINEYRTHMRRARYPIYDAGTSPADGEFEPPEDLLPSGGPNPEEELLWKEYEARIQHCLKRLRSSEHLALVCKLIGYSDKEVAALLGEPEKKVMFSIIPLGRRKLRKCISSYL